MYTAVIVGCGTIAGLYDDTGTSDSIVSHAAGYHNHDMFDLSGCVDSNKKTVERFAELQNIVHFDTNLVTVLNAVQPDIVSIATPDDSHYSIVSLILRCVDVLPKLIFLEKPACQNSKELESLLEMSDSVNVPIVVNHSRRFHSLYAAVKQKYEAGQLGELLGIDCSYYGGWVHSGVHLVDTIRYLFSTEIVCPDIIERITSRNIDDPTLTIKAKLETNDGSVLFQGWDDKHYQIFDLEFRFSTGRLIVRNFEQQYIWEACIENSVGERVLVPKSMELSMNGKSPMMRAMDILSNYLKTGDIETLHGYLLRDVATSLRSIWQVDSCT